MSFFSYDMVMWFKNFCCWFYTTNFFLCYAITYQRTTNSFQTNFIDRKFFVFFRQIFLFQKQKQKSISSSQTILCLIESLLIYHKYQCFTVQVNKFYIEFCFSCFYSWPILIPTHCLHLFNHPFKHAVCLYIICRNFDMNFVDCMCSNNVVCFKSLCFLTNGKFH